MVLVGPVWLPTVREAAADSLVLFFSFSSVCQTQRSPVNGDDGFVFLIFEFLSMVDEALSWEVFFFFFLHLERERFLLTDIC